MRAHRAKRWLPPLFALVLLKLRFVLLGIGLLALRLRKRRAVIIAAIIVAPMILLTVIVGNPLNVHSWRELLPVAPSNYARGFFGLLLDGAGGIAFQAPFFLLGIYAITRWRETPKGFRYGILASLLYILYLLPRDEWTGGWSPPLRYIVFLMPVLAFGAASVWHRVSRGVVMMIVVWTIGVALHGLARPWRLFHIANGENAIGEWLSTMYRADFSRMFPSFIRINDAAIIGSVVLIAILLLARLRIPSHVAISVVALAIAYGFVVAQRPARTIQFEDAHVVHEGGALYPEEYAVIRFAYRGGWVLNANDSLSFLAQQGPHTLEYVSGPGARIAIDGSEVRLPSNGDHYATARINVPHAGRVTLRCLEGAVNLDRMVREDNVRMVHD
jgi:hypothetical protein